MKLIRIEDKNGIRYITENSKYRIWKYYKKADWELGEITGHGYKYLGYFKYFKDAKKYLEKLTT